MQRPALLAPVSALCFAVGCTPARLATPPSPGDGEEVASVLVYRTLELNAGGISLVFGADGTDYLKLKGDDYAELQLPPNTYHFFVRSNQADRSFVLEKVLHSGDHKCLRAYANPNNILKVPTFVGYYFGNTFKLLEVECPSQNELARYDKLQCRLGTGKSLTFVRSHNTKVCTVDDAYWSWIVTIVIGILFGIFLPHGKTVKWSAISFGVIATIAVFYFIVEAGPNALWLIIVLPLLGVLFALGVTLGLAAKALASRSKH